MTNEKIRLTPRDVALNIMCRVAEKGAYANLELNKVLAEGKLSGLDRAFVTELVYGAIRMQGNLDYILGLFIKKPLTSLDLWILLILRQGVYQMIYLDKVPDRAAVNEAVNLAKKYGHPGTVKFVNGVLRTLSRERERIVYPDIKKDPVAHIAAVYSHPDWLVKRWLKQFGLEDTIHLCEIDNQAPPVTVRVNTLKCTREELLERLQKEEIRAYPGRFAPESIVLEGTPPLASLSAFQEGLFQVQDESSMLAAHVLSPQPGSRVIDACAAPGGKTTHMAQLMQNEGTIKAYDVHPHKVGLIKESCRRLGIGCVEAAQGDASRLPEALRQWADYCLVDAPCSGLGVLRRRPDARWSKKESSIQELAGLQKEILDSAAQTVKLGGVLVYSTCTLAPEENELMVAWFLKSHPDFKLEPLAEYLPLELSEKDRHMADLGMIQLLPHIHGTDGLFMARMKKKERG